MARRYFVTQGQMYFSMKVQVDDTIQRTALMFNQSCSADTIAKQMEDFWVH